MFGFVQKMVTGMPLKFRDVAENSSGARHQFRDAPYYRDAPWHVSTECGREA